MKIALLGYGRMGKVIEKIALQRGHEIVIRYNGKAPCDITLADVAIDFSLPHTAFGNITNCLTNNVPVISGTTGWLKDYKNAVKICEQNSGGFIYASNFSLGVNLFFELNRQLTKMMQAMEEYDVSIEEIHHTKKLDAPSGTAITLAEEIIELSDKTKWELDTTSDANSIPITAIRTPDVPGTHRVSYQSDIDSIEIKHTAHTRQGFALGAVIAAEWLVGKSGVYSMRDVLNLG